MKRNWWIVLLLALSAIHCVQSIFFVSYSFINLEKYEVGREAMPFQGRVAMMPLLHWAHGSPFLTHFAKDVERQPADTRLKLESWTPEKLVSFWAALVSMAVTLAVCARYGAREAPQLWWACPALAIAIFYATDAARSDQAIWYPYDMPHTALFTLGCFALLRGSWTTLAVVFLLDTPMRETSVYLLALLLAVGYVQRRLPSALLLASCLAVAWLGTRLWISRHFRGNPSDLGLHYHHISQALRMPQHWPQLASVFGFLAVPLFVNRRYLTPVERALVYGAIPGALVSSFFGVWFETRVWLEWNGLVACLVFAVFARYVGTLGSLRPTGVRQRQEASVP